MCDETNTISGWREIYYLETNTWRHSLKALWNDEMYICLLAITNNYYNEIEENQSELMREVKCFKNYVEAIKWAQEQLPQMWQAWKTWYEANKGQKKQNG